MNVWLRHLILDADLMHREYGGRAKVTKILGSGLFETGNVAELAPMGLPVGQRRRAGPDWTIYPEWICERLRKLYPFGPGGETAELIETRIRLRVPHNGYPRDSFALADWALYGVTPGEVKLPRRLAI